VLQSNPLERLSRTHAFPDPMHPLAPLQWPQLALSGRDQALMAGFSLHTVHLSLWTRCGEPRTLLAPIWSEVLKTVRFQRSEDWSEPLNSDPLQRSRLSLHSSASAP